MRRNDERNDKTDVHRSDKAKGLHTRNMEKDKKKRDLREKKMWNMLVITARFALCQRFTNCTQQSYTTDFTTDVGKQRTREGFDVHTKRWIILQHTDCLNRYQNVGRDSGLHEGI